MKAIITLAICLIAATAEAGFTTYTTARVTPSTITVKGVNGVDKQIENPAYPSTPQTIYYTPPTYDRFSATAALRTVLLEDPAGTESDATIIANFPNIFDEATQQLLDAALAWEKNYISGVGFSILASGVSLNLTKAKAVTTWSNNLWTIYYTRKATLTVATMKSPNTDFSSAGDMPYSTVDLNAELQPYIGSVTINTVVPTSKTAVEGQALTAYDATTGAFTQAAVGGAPPASTVSAATSYGISSAVGTATDYARGDHNHGTPATVKDTTAVTGLLKGNGSAISAASAGTDYLTPSGSAASLTSFPTLNQNTSGTAANLSGTPALPNGTTATTQTAADNSTKLATTAYVDSGLSGKAASSHNQAESTITFTDITTGNASATSHGYAPKGTAGTTQYWREDWTLGTPGGSAPTIYPKTADQTINSTTPAAVTGLTWSIAAGAAQTYHCTIHTTNTATSLIRFSMQCPTSPTSVNTMYRYTSTNYATQLLAGTGACSALGTTTASVTASVLTTGITFFVYGSILNGANAGTMQLYSIDSTNGQSNIIRKGSHCEVVTQ